MENYSISKWGHVIWKPKKVAVWGRVAIVMSSAGWGRGVGTVSTSRIHSSQQGVRSWMCSMCALELESWELGTGCLHASQEIALPL